MNTTRKSAKSIRAEERRVACMPIEQWMSHIGFSAEEISTMQAESAARLAGTGVK